jgi:hypothetical protein
MQQLYGTLTYNNSNYLVLGMISFCEQKFGKRNLNTMHLITSAEC